MTIGVQNSNRNVRAKRVCKALVPNHARIAVCVCGPPPIVLLHARVQHSGGGGPCFIDGDPKLGGGGAPNLGGFFGGGTKFGYLGGGSAKFGGFLRGEGTKFGYFGEGGLQNLGVFGGGGHPGFGGVLRNFGGLLLVIGGGPTLFGIRGANPFWGGIPIFFGGVQPYRDPNPFWGVGGALSFRGGSQH